MDVDWLLNGKSVSISVRITAVLSHFYNSSYSANNLHLKIKSLGFDKSD